MAAAKHTLPGFEPILERDWCWHCDQGHYPHEPPSCRKHGSPYDDLKRQEWTAAEKFIGTRDRVEVSAFLQAFWWREARYASAVRFARRLPKESDPRLDMYRHTLVERVRAHVVPEATLRDQEARRARKRARKARCKAATKARAAQQQQ